MGTIDEYLESLDPADATVIGRAYAVACEAVPDAVQGRGYGMPALTYRGKSLLALMRAKNHIGVYPFSAAAIVAISALLPGADVTKGAIRFPPGQPLPDDTIRALVLARRTQIDSA